MENTIQFEKNKIKEIEINLAWGQLNIISEPIEHIQIIVTGDDEAVSELEIDMKDDKIKIEQSQLSLAKGVGSGRWLELVIRIPEDQNFPIDAQSISGSINIKELKTKTIKVESIIGKIVLSNILSEDIKIKNVSGDVSGKALTAEKIKIRTVSGEVVLEDSTFTKMQTKSVSGNYLIKLLNSFEYIDHNTISGDMTIYAPIDEVCIEKRRTIKGKIDIENINITDTLTKPRLKVNNLLGDISLISEQRIDKQLS